MKVVSRCMGWIGMMMAMVSLLSACSSGGGGDKVGCGDGLVNGTEQCDKNDLGGKTCEALNKGSGTLVCNLDCTFDIRGCAGGSSCGNGALDQGEECDSTNLNGKTCQALGYASGTLVCRQNCFYDTTGCQGAPCGNGTLDQGEECDGGNLNGATCESRGFAGGTLVCGSCRFDESGCASGNNCGNGTLDVGEDCDGANLNSKTCQSLGFTSGTLACTIGCLFDTIACEGNPCGNGVIDLGEDCEGSDLGGASCESIGEGSGTLVCDTQCFFDTMGCVGGSNLCGNGVIDLEEWEECDGTDLAGQTCLGLGYLGGMLACDPEYCWYDTNQCQSACGNGALDEYEECDGANLNNATCQSLGYLDGVLGCDPEYCWYDTSQCQDACGNGQIEPEEACDGANLNGKTCQSFGFDSGTLTCLSYCEFDKSLCTGTCQDDANEPNSSSETPKPIQLDYTGGNLVLCGSSDEDWFRVDLAANTIYSFKATFLHAEGDIDAYLYLATDTFSSVASGASTADNEEFQYVGDPGSYQLKIVRYSSPIFSQRYGLEVKAAGQAECRLNTDCAPGLVCVSYKCVATAQGDQCASPVVIGALPYQASNINMSSFFNDLWFDSTTCTKYSTRGRDVIYQLTLAAGQKIKVDVNSSFDASLYFINACTASPLPDGTCLAGIDVALSGETETLEYTAAAAGVVFLVVDHYLEDEPDSGDFDISITQL